MSYEDEVEELITYEDKKNGVIFNQDELNVKSLYEFNGKQYDSEWKVKNAYKIFHEDKWIEENEKILREAWNNMGGDYGDNPLIKYVLRGDGKQWVSPYFSGFASAMYKCRGINWYKLTSGK